ncbi:uncharacterized protein Dana_GF24092 [Drosophila ananassae]|uniref:Polypeptide N-acetylgalactosaminyltransferase n=1 Tax=Drosophila ananassae TaxID=7217 RepID=B3M9W9_DROAN|nr:polypeptide N-acetylgalactosaminyltransferase 8 [Drosophila ananassae]EDV40160.1 uncharacterized protein Dana_GF24092 [Drosophila ananassae]
MCIEILRHKKKVLLLLLLTVAGSIIFYLYTLRLERDNASATSTSTTSRLEREISDLQALFESKVVPQLGDLGRPARRNWTAGERQAMAQSMRGVGFNSWLSQRISSERSLYDMRHRSCKKLEYSLEKLPSVSVVITYHDEEASVLLRTLSSLRNRTPILLLREIILVDDGSTNVDPKLSDFLQIKFLNMVKHHRLDTQVGLMKARVTGAQLALADVLVFLDSHVEVTQGWLEPLIAPILQNNRTCTTPIIDTIDYDNFAYRRGKPSRGFFNWEFNYIQLPLLKEEAVALPAPHKNPIMNGGLFAIGRQWFFDLGGYDKGLKIWGAEQFELSLKIWLCGGSILEVPCSRVGHLYRDPNFHIHYTHQNKESEKKVISRNYRRVAEVWLDDYKDKLFEKMPHLTVIQVGSLTEEKALKKRLHCKPFKWFLDQLGKDFLNLYPVVEPVDFAFGVLQSLASPKLCLDRSEGKPGQPKLSECPDDHTFPESELKWTLTNHRELRSGPVCLEKRNQQGDIYVFQCHGQMGNQFWSLNTTSQQVVHGQMGSSRRCLEIQPDAKGVTTRKCDSNNAKQRWKFGYKNNHRLQHFWDNVKTS